jgi:hypothetical protein
VQARRRAAAAPGAVTAMWFGVKVLLEKIDESGHPGGAALARRNERYACATGTQFSEYQVITAQGVVQQWRRFDGW